MKQEKVIVQVVAKDKQLLPVYQTAAAAGLDLMAALNEPVLIKPLQRELIPTGIKMAIPKGYEGQIRPRSGLAYKYGLTCLNSPGTIDADYRGEIKVLLINLGHQDYWVNPGERIAQLVICPVATVDLQLVTQLEDTERGAGGFGHTGK